MRLCPASLPTRSCLSKAACLLIAGAGAAAGSGTAWADDEPVEVEFNSQFLRNTGGAPMDASRFKRGNVASPGNYRAELFVNQSWMGRVDVSLQPVGKDAHDVDRWSGRRRADTRPGRTE